MFWIISGMIRTNGDKSSCDVEQVRHRNSLDYNFIWLGDLIFYSFFLFVFSALTDLTVGSHV
uniref:Uncharacterized protein n=1 Tax=Rhizophora mucronata TaxID=61149 RepID=A0A2P2QQN2_RHIMU